MDFDGGQKNPKGKILVVDDTPGNLRLLISMLGAQGYIVHPAISGKDALRFLQTTLPDLVLLDIRMPGMDGYEVCRQIKADERTRNLPVIFISAADEVLDKVTAFSSGGIDYVVKPLQEEEVLARINTHLTLAQLQKSLEERVRERTAALTEANSRLNEEISERKLVEAELRTREAQIRSLVDADIIGIFFWDIDRGVIDANDAFLSIIGHDRNDLMAGKIDLAAITPPEYLDRDQNAFLQLKQSSRFVSYDKEFLRKDGERVPVMIGGTFIEGSHQAGVSFVLDLTERKHAEKRIKYLAQYDSLSGLLNRKSIIDRLDQCIMHVQPGEHHHVTVFLLDVDDFKRINDSLGQQIGDRLLQMTARRLESCLRHGDSIARAGGDEFVLLFPALHERSDAVLIAEKVLNSMKQPFAVNGHELHISSSIGISMYPHDGANAVALLGAADAAMFEAKKRGRDNYQFYTASLDAALKDRFALENQLRRAWMHKELAVYYQPQVDMETGNIYSAEALLRWEQPGASPVSFARFVPIAESTGLILPIGEWLLRQCCLELQYWRNHGSPDLRVAINLSPRQFEQGDLHEQVAKILEEFDLPADALDLEITESILMQPSEDNLTVLNRLSEMGIHLSLDDFGTGYSSLAYLQRFPIDVLKIDKAFINGLLTSPNDQALVTAIIAMAESLQIKVLAEGVETLQQAQFLQKNGCKAAQGFYYSEAVPSTRFAELLQSQGGQRMRPSFDSRPVPAK
ncbi:EAL domain-containing protein [Noviherbaspirillum sp. ST9]|uniref:two-component system response regulator n=1 Tax=Noviherbaspirillum sp. ST9 TaxID=3401606 RepID=UPI003B586B46